MQLIIRCFTLAFYSVLLFLRESSADLDPTNSQYACQKAVNDLFSLTQVCQISWGGGLQDYIVIPDNNLIQLFYTAASPEPQIEGKLLREPNESVVLNHFNFVSNHTIMFTVKHPDEGKRAADYVNTFKGTARIVCTGQICREAISKVKNHLSGDTDELTCLKDVDGPYISGSFGEGVVIRLPWNHRYLIFSAKNTLEQLVASEDPVPHRWEVTQVGLLDGVMTYSNKVNGDVATFPLQRRVSTDLRDHILAATKFLDHGRLVEHLYNTHRGPKDIKKQQHVFYLDKVPRKSFPLTKNRPHPVTVDIHPYFGNKQARKSKGKVH